MFKHYVVIDYPLGDEDSNVHVFSGVNAQSKASKVCRELINDYACNLTELYRDPDLSPRTLYGDEPNLTPYIDGAFRFAEFLGNDELEWVLETQYEKIVVRRSNSNQIVEEALSL